MDQQSIEPRPIELFLGHPLISAPDYIVPLNRPYVIKNLLLAGQVSLLVGPPNIGKSSVVACLAASVAMGRSVGPLRVRRSAVLYVAAEDPHGIAERASGIWQSMPGDIAQFYIHGYPVNLSNRDDVMAFEREARLFQNNLSADELLIVFDTLNLCIGDGDENSARDMGRVIGHAQTLARKMNAHVMIIHHTSAADVAKPRGSTAMHGNVDTLLVLRRIEGQSGESLVLLTPEKQRSVKKGKPLVFEISSFDVGCDKDGEMITVPLARPAVLTPALLAKAKDRRAAAGKADARADEVLRVLRALQGKAPSEAQEARVIAARVGEPFEDVRANPDSLRKAVERALKMLIADRRVEGESSGGYRVALPPTGND